MTATISTETTTEITTPRELKVGDKVRRTTTFHVMYDAEDPETKGHDYGDSECKFGDIGTVTVPSSMDTGVLVDWDSGGGSCIANKCLTPMTLGVIVGGAPAWIGLPVEVEERSSEWGTGPFLRPLTSRPDGYGKSSFYWTDNPTDVVWGVENLAQAQVVQELGEPEVVEEPTAEEPVEEIVFKVGDRVQISDAPEMACGGGVDELFYGAVGVIVGELDEDGDYDVEVDGVEDYVGRKHVSAFEGFLPGDYVVVASSPVVERLDGSEGWVDPAFGYELCVVAERTDVVVPYGPTYGPNNARCELFTDRTYGQVIANRCLTLSSAPSEPEVVDAEVVEEPVEETKPVALAGWEIELLGYDPSKPAFKVGDLVRIGDEPLMKDGGPVQNAFAGKIGTVITTDGWMVDTHGPRVEVEGIEWPNYIGPLHLIPFNPADISPVARPVLEHPSQLDSLGNDSVVVVEGGVYRPFRKLDGRWEGFEGEKGPGNYGPMLADEVKEGNVTVAVVGTRS